MAAVCVFLLLGDSDVKKIVQEELPATELLEPICYVEYAGTYLCLDSEKNVCANMSERPTDLPKISGINFSRLTYGYRARSEDDTELDYIITVVLDLQNGNIPIEEIHMEAGCITLYSENIRILLGANEKTDTKISDLADFFDQVIVLDGTLDMTDANAQNYGYVFSQDTDEEEDHTDEYQDSSEDSLEGSGEKDIKI